MIARIIIFLAWLGLGLLRLYADDFYGMLICIAISQIWLASIKDFQ